MRTKLFLITAALALAGAAHAACGGLGLPISARKFCAEQLRSDLVMNADIEIWCEKTCDTLSHNLYPPPQDGGRACHHGCKARRASDDSHARNSECDCLNSF